MFSQQQIEGYHKQAANALLTNETNYHAGRRFRNLTAVFEVHRNDPLFLELIVMSGLFVQRRHYFIVRVLLRLRKIREKKGEIALFETFERMIASNKQGILINNHGYGTRTLADVDPITFYDSIKASIKAVTELGFQVAVNSGTLLGLVRDGSLIAFDDDVDLFVVLQSNSHQMAAQEFLSLAQQLYDSGHENAFKLAREGIIKLNEIDGFEIDLFPAYQIETEIYIYPYGFGNLTVQDVLPLCCCPNSGLPLPQNPEKVLQANYGQSWQTPDPLFLFPWSSQNRKFAVLREALQERAE